MADDIVTRAKAENWRAVVGYVGIYEVSDLGRIRSIDRTVRRSDGTYLCVAGRLLSLASCDRVGHPRVSLSTTGRAVVRPIHRLVLEAFMGACPVGMEACHNNGLPHDNRLVNLRWDTRSSNSRDCVNHGNHPKRSRAHCPQGHPYSGANLHRHSKGRKCRACQSIHNAVKPIGPNEHVEHGRPVTYNRGCRCDTCRRANTARAREFRARKRASQ